MAAVNKLFYRNFGTKRILSATPNEILRIYRTILKLAAVYPSVKRKSLVMEIKYEFHLNKTLDDPIKISDSIKKAIYGISHLKKYSELDPSSTEWIIDLEKEPMPPPERES